MIGQRFKSNSCNEFTVLKQVGRTGWTPLYEIEFDEVNSVKYRTTTRKDSILDGRVKNPFYPSLYGIGYLGNANSQNEAYDRWRHMLGRCYDQNDPKYATYGGQGVTVCDSWLCFENYLADTVAIEGYDKDNFKNLVLDKDIKIKGNKIYSPETCIFVTASENSAEMNNRTNPRFLAFSPAGEVFESNNQREFARNYNLTHVGINDVLLGRQKTHRGWTFKYAI
jgi:hypothetical protein